MSTSPLRNIHELQLATRMPNAITSSCAFDMESLISDVNRSVATLAITTLLKVPSDEVTRY